MSGETSLIMIIIGAALINNVVLSQFLGICSFLGVSKQMKASISLGGAVIFVITIASAVASLLYDRSDLIICRRSSLSSSLQRLFRSSRCS